MNKLTQFLIEDLVDQKKKVMVTGGSYKVPTKGHFTVAEQAIKENKDIDEFILFVGSGNRDGIDQKTSIEIWEIYNKYLPMNVSIKPVNSPITAIYDYAKEHPEEKILWIVGSREGNQEDIIDLEKRTKAITKYPNVEVKEIRTKGGASGTLARKAIRDGDKEAFFSLLPPQVKEKEEIWNLVTPLIKELKDNELRYWALYANIYNELVKDKNPDKNYIELKDKLTGEPLVALNYFYSEYFKDGVSTINENLELEKENYINRLIDYCCLDLDIPKPEIILINDNNYTKENNSFGGYSPNENKIYLVIKDRNIRDILSTLSHEIFHSYQNKNNLIKPGDGKDGDEIENQANAYAGKTMRQFGRENPEIFFMFNGS